MLDVAILCIDESITRIFEHHETKPLTWLWKRFVTKTYIKRYKQTAVHKYEMGQQVILAIKICLKENQLLRYYQKVNFVLYDLIHETRWCNELIYSWQKCWNCAFTSALKNWFGALCAFQLMHRSVIRILFSCVKYMRIETVQYWINLQSKVVTLIRYSFEG